MIVQIKNKLAINFLNKCLYYLYSNNFSDHPEMLLCYYNDNKIVHLAQDLIQK